VLGTGIVPGISNVMVRALANDLGGADEMQTSLLLGAEDISGPASFDYFLQELAMRFDVWIDGKDVPARAFSAPREIRFPPPIGSRAGYLFPFSDQVLYPRTIGAKTAITRLAIDPPWLARILALAARTGVSHLLATPVVRHALAQQRKDRPSSEGAPFALRVEVRHAGSVCEATLLGRTQADAAAAGAIGVARVLMEERLQSGAWMPEKVVEPAPFFAHLADLGLAVQLHCVRQKVAA
jgi:hypothetical protein